MYLFYSKLKKFIDLIKYFNQRRDRKINQRPEQTDYNSD